jgi:hypothetical protein
MALSSFIVGLVVILIILVISCIMTALLCVKIRSATVGTESIYPPSSTYHAFSSSASKAWTRIWAPFFEQILLPNKVYFLFGLKIVINYFSQALSRRVRSNR